MRKLLWAALLVGLSLWSRETAMGQVYVATTGDDQAAGTQDKPVASLNRAVDLARKSGAKRIVVAGGKYYDVGVTLGAADSGLTIEGAPGGEPAVLVGGVKIGHWEKDGDFVAAKLPEGRQWEVRMLQVAGRMCGRARYPEKGVLQCLNVFDVRNLSATEGGFERKPTKEELTTLKYAAGDLPAGFEYRNAEVTVFHSWNESCVGVTANDPTSRVLTLAPPTDYPAGGFNHHEYVVWNGREGMTTRGEWYWDRVGNRVVYWPLEGEDMAQVEAVVPTRFSIVTIKGDADGPVKDVALRNLRLEVATVPVLTGGMAAGAYPGAIEMAKVQGVRLEGLTIRQVGGHAVRAGSSDKEPNGGIAVENCDVSECGAGGIYVQGNGTVLRNNLIRKVGVAYPSAQGVRGRGKDCTVSHNEVGDTPYSAIDFHGENVVVEANLLHDCMQVLKDGAAIYMFGGKNNAMRGNVVRGIRDSGSAGEPASAYYLDEQSEGCTIEGNVAENVAWPLHNHMAKNNTIRGNVIVTDGDMRVTLHKCSDYTMEGNIFYAGARMRLEAPGGTEWRGNLAYSGVGKIQTVRVQGNVPKETVEEAPEGTVVADPGFVDPAHGDYRVAQDGPAGKAGLKGVDGRNAGRAQ